MTVSLYFYMVPSVILSSLLMHLLFWLIADCELDSGWDDVLDDFLCSCFTSSLARLLGGAFTKAKSSSVTT